jgi:hypothetical protein
MSKDINQEIQEIVQIVEQMHEVCLTNTKKRLENLKRINIELLTIFVESERQNGNMKGKKDIIKYIDSLTQD